MRRCKYSHKNKKDTKKTNESKSVISKKVVDLLEELKNPTGRSKAFPQIKKDVCIALKNCNVKNSVISQALEVSESTIKNWTSGSILREDVMMMTGEIRDQLQLKHLLRANDALDHMTPEKMAEAKVDKLAVVAGITTQRMLDLIKIQDRENPERVMRTAIEVNAKVERVIDQKSSLDEEINLLKRLKESG